MLKGKISAKEPLSLDLICEIHRVLTSGTYDERRYIDSGERPGEFKKHDYVTGANEVGSAPEAVPADLSALIEEDLKPLTAFLKEETVKTWARVLGDEGREARKGLSSFLLP